MEYCIARIIEPFYDFNELRADGIKNSHGVLLFVALKSPFNQYGMSVSEVHA
jgi:hypothetical protein